MKKMNEKKEMTQAVELQDELLDMVSGGEEPECDEPNQTNPNISLKPEGRKPKYSKELFTPRVGYSGGKKIRIIQQK